MTDQPRLLTDPAELAALVDEIRAAGRFALDTEFVWERTYRPQLGVVQIATDRGSAILDALALPDLSSLFPLLRDPDVPVVLHGGGQDLEILAVLMGEPVRGVVDTQVVAAFLGYGLQVGLGVLLERVLRVRLRKDQTYTDWTRRPLKPEQLAYAREDVVHLLPLHDRLRAALDQRGRTAWVAEELRGLEDPAHWAPVADEERYRGVKGWQRLGGGELAVLRALAAWRERTARHVDIRPHFVANDVVLTTLAGRPVESLEELRGVRGLSPGTVSRHGRGLLAAIREGLASRAGAAARTPDGPHGAPARGGAGGRGARGDRSRGHREHTRHRGAGRARHGPARGGGVGAAPARPRLARAADRRAVAGDRAGRAGDPLRRPAQGDRGGAGHAGGRIRTMMVLPACTRSARGRKKPSQAIQYFRLYASPIRAARSGSRSSSARASKCGPLSLPTQTSSGLPLPIRRALCEPGAVVKVSASPSQLNHTGTTLLRLPSARRVAM